jgi:hypothetical protein
MAEDAVSVPSSRRPYYSTPSATSRPEPANLADILERILDKGIIIAGDIKVNLLDIELLTIKIRLLIVSVDKAQEMGIDWWRNDPMLTTSEQGLAEENRRLRERIEALEAATGTQPDDGSDDGSDDASDDGRDDG